MCVHACVFVCIHIHRCVCVYVHMCWNWQMRTKLNEVLYFYNLLNAGFHCSHNIK